MQSNNKKPEAFYVYCKYFQYSDNELIAPLKKDLNGHPKANHVYRAVRGVKFNDKEAIVIKVEEEDRGTAPGFDGMTIPELRSVNNDFSCYFEEFKVSDVFDLNVPESQIDKVVKWEQNNGKEEVLRGVKESKRVDEIEMMKSILGNQLSKLLPEPVTSSSAEENNFAKVDIVDVLQGLNIGFLETSAINSLINYSKSDSQNSDKLLEAFDYFKAYMTYEFGQEFTKWALTERED